MRSRRREGNLAAALRVGLRGGVQKVLALQLRFVQRARRGLLVVSGMPRGEEEASNRAQDVARHLTSVMRAYTSTYVGHHRALLRVHAPWTWVLVSRAGPLYCT